MHFVLDFSGGSRELIGLDELHWCLPSLYKTAVSNATLTEVLPSARLAHRSIICRRSAASGGLCLQIP